MITPNEAQLVSAVQNGDRAALGDLLEHYQHRLYNVVLHIVCHRDDAAEITQDAMLKAIERFDQFRGDSQFATWIIRIAMNLSISHLRKARHRRATSIDDAPNGAATIGSQLPDWREPQPAQSVEINEMLTNLHTAIASLDPYFRAVLVLRDIDQMDYEQIAEVLGVALGTVKSRLFRARLALRNEMNNFESSSTTPQRPHDG